METAVWICGQYISGEMETAVWSFQGVFSTKEKALLACKNSNFFIAPAILDKELPIETEEWPGIEYPIE